MSDYEGIVSPNADKYSHQLSLRLSQNTRLCVFVHMSSYLKETSSMWVIMCNGQIFLLRKLQIMPISIC